MGISEPWDDTPYYQKRGETQTTQGKGWSHRMRPSTTGDISEWVSKGKLRQGHHYQTLNRRGAHHSLRALTTQRYF